MLFESAILTPFYLLLGTILVAALLAFLSRTVLPGLRESRLRKNARHWPAIRARLDHACVTEYRPSDSIITFRLDAWFTYTVEGKSHEGSYSNEDMRHDEAKKLLSKLNREPVTVRYNPSKPAEYFYRPGDPDSSAPSQP